MDARRVNPGRGFFGFSSGFVAGEGSASGTTSSSSGLSFFDLLRRGLAELSKSELIDAHLANLERRMSFCDSTKRKAEDDVLRGKLRSGAAFCDDLDGPCLWMRGES